MKQDANSTTFPDVKAYLSVQLYIQDIYNFRKTYEPEFSYDKWSKEIGIKNRSYLRLLITGRRLFSNEMIELFIKHLKFEADEKEYFTCLVQYSQVKQQEQKQLYGRKLIQILKKELNQVELNNHFDFVSDPFLPKLRSLLSYDELQEVSAAKLGILLGVEEKVVLEGLDKLFVQGLAIPNGEKGWKATNKSVKVNDRLGDIGLEMYHTNSLNEAIKAQKLPTQERRFRSLLLAMDEKEFSQFLAGFQEFIENQLSIHETKSFEGRKLYQMNFNLFPLSKKISES